MHGVHVDRVRFPIARQDIVVLESFCSFGPVAHLVERVIRIDEAGGSNPPRSTGRGAYSSAVERVHGMDEVGVRLPVGPQNNYNDILSHVC